jgi:hypothetical protein
MFDETVLYVTLIQVSGTFVALMAGFAVNRYFTNNSERQRYVYEQRLNQPELSRLQELVENQRNLRIDDESEHVLETMLDLLYEKPNITDDEIIQIAKPDLETEDVTKLIHKIRYEYTRAGETINSKLGALIPQPTSEQLVSLGIEVDDFSRPIYLRRLREIGDQKRKTLNINNPFNVNLSAMDSLAKMRIPLIPAGLYAKSGNSEAKNVELLKQALHLDLLLTAEIEARKSAMKMSYFYIASGLTTILGLIIPTYLLTRRPISDWIFVRNYLLSALVACVGLSFWYVYKTVNSNLKNT